MDTLMEPGPGLILQGRGGVGGGTPSYAVPDAQPPYSEHCHAPDPNPVCAEAHDYENDDHIGRG